MSIELLTLIMFGGLILLLILGVPISFAMGGITVAVTLFLWGTAGLFRVVFYTYGLMVLSPMIAIPCFIFMGLMLERSGIADELFEALYRWFAAVRGGLAMATTVICALFAAMTGVAAAAATTMGLVAVPAMLKRRYDKSLALGTVAGPSTLGILIPPSITMVILAVTSQTSVGKLFMAGIIPGILLTLLFCAYIGIRGLLQPQLCPAVEERFTLAQKMVLTRALILPIFIILSVLGSIFLGLATPTEASAMGAAGTIIAVAVRRRLTWKVIQEAALITFKITGMILWIGFAAIAFSNTWGVAGGSEFFTGLLLGLGVNRWLILIAVMLIVFVMGMFVADFPIIWIIAPIAYPIIETLGFDPVWFGLLFIMNIQMALITPPFGFVLFYLKAVAPPGISLGDIYRSIFPFLGVMILGMALVMIFPQLALWLPGMMIRR